MPVAELCRRQAVLLVSVVPFVGVEKSFAHKGGTAINLFGTIASRRQSRNRHDCQYCFSPWNGISSLLQFIFNSCRQKRLKVHASPCPPSLRGRSSYYNSNIG